MKIPAFKLELEMKISAFESSFERRGSQMGFRKWGRDAPFFVLLRFGFLKRLASERLVKLQKWSVMHQTCKASERLVMHRKWPIKLQEWPVCII